MSENIDLELSVAEERDLAKSAEADLKIKDPTERDFLEYLARKGIINTDK